MRTEKLLLDEMKITALLGAAGLALGILASSTACAEPANQPEALPKDAHRQILGIWKLRSPDCTRAIEQIGNLFFIVARCLDSARIDGSIGIPLSRITATSYRNLSGVTYEIDAEGHLLVKVGEDVFDRGVPMKNLWPEKQAPAEGSRSLTPPTETATPRSAQTPR